MVNDIAAKNLTDQLTTPPRKKRIITLCSLKDWTQFVQGSSDDEEEACKETNISLTVTTYNVCCDDTNTIFEENSFAFGPITS
uniref:Uncharacterized protein n=1 Tax=Romanomermis culicivorax TaxID=13658 RepID=A0A915HNH5_ROMCU